MTEHIDPDVNLLDQYREKLKQAIGTARFYGLPDRPLEKVFVELTVIEDFEIPRDAKYKALMDKELRRRRTLFPQNGNNEETDKLIARDEEGPFPTHRGWPPVKPTELLKEGNRTQVVGAPGCGKTTLLRWLALQTMAFSPDRLPVLIELKTLGHAQLDAIGIDFPAFLFQEGIQRRFDETDFSTEHFADLENTFYEFDKAGRLVILLDGLDEIAESERHRLRTAVENYAGNREGGLTLIVSTRPYGYLQDFANLRTMEIEPLSDRQINKFLDHWREKPTAETVKANLRKNPKLRSLARFPFLLACIASLDSGGDIPRIELYRQIVAGLITRLDREKGIQKFEIDDPDGVLKHRFLKRFAFGQLFEKPELELSSGLVFHVDEILNAARAFLREEAPTIPAHHLAQDVCATPLLREVEAEHFSFAHPTVHEYLAAEELSKRKDCHKRFAQAFFNRQLAEMEVLPMTIGLADDPNEFYELLFRFPESTDSIGLRLLARGLSYCQKEIGPVHYQTLQQKLTNFGLGENRREVIFSKPVINSFSGIHDLHFQYLNGGLLKDLGNRHVYLRQSAVAALGILGSASPQVIDVLVSSLRDQDEYVRRCAADALGKLGSDSPQVITALVNALHDPDENVRRLADTALLTLGTAFPQVITALVNILGDQDKYVCRRAATILGTLGVLSPEVATVLVNTLGNQDKHLRRRAADILGKRGAPSPQVITTLVNALDDQDKYLRRRAATILGILGIPSPEVAAALVTALNDKDWDVRRRAAGALGLLGSASAEVIAALIKAMGDQNRHVRPRAAAALGTLGSPTPEVTSALINALCDQDESMRHRTAVALRTLGFASTETNALLNNTLYEQEAPPYDQEEDTYQDTDSFDTPDTVNTDDITSLVKALRDEDFGERYYAAHRLGTLEVDSPDVVSAFIRALRDRAVQVRQLAAEYLERIGFDSPEFLEGLKLLLSDPDPELQKMALRSIGYPSTDPGLLDDLKKLTESDNPEIREAAEDAHRKYKFKIETLGLLPA